MRDRAPTVFFIGSGVSWYSGLPLFSDLKSRIFDVLPERAAGRLEFLSTEGFLAALADAGIDVGASLRAIFNSSNARPNEIHQALANRLLQGDIVWTTNYDTLVEDSLPTVDSQAHEAACKRIHKPHGSFMGNYRGWTSDAGLFFQPGRIRLQWAREHVSRLKHDSAGVDLVLVGYSGQDVAPFRHLTSAIEGARTVNWYEPREETIGEILDRFPAMESAATTHGPRVVWHDQDYVKFRQTYCGGAIAGLSLPAAQSSTQEEAIEFLTTSIRSMPVQLLILERAGERELLERYLADMWQSVRHTRDVHDLVSVRRLWRLTIRFKVRDKYFRRGRKALWSALLLLPATTPASEAIRARASATHECPSTNRDRHLDKMSRWTEKSRDPIQKVRLLLSLSRCLRQTGCYTQALEASQRSLGISTGDVSAGLLDAEHASRIATLAAQAQFEIVESARSLGWFERANDHLRLRQEASGMIHWKAWLDYERGCIALQLGDYKAARAAVNNARSFFDPAGRRRQYKANDAKFFCDVAWAAILRCCGETLNALEQLKAIRTEQSSVYEDKPLRKGLLHFHFGETLRLLDRFDEAEHEYRLIDPSWEMHGALQLTGLAFLLLSKSEPATDVLTKARMSFEAHQCAWGVELINSQLGEDLRCSDGASSPPAIRFV